MADAVGVEPKLTDNKKAREHDPEDDDIEAVKEKHTEPASPNGSKVEKVETAKKEEEKPKPSKFKELWGKIGLDAGTLLMMFKWVSKIQSCPCVKLIYGQGLSRSNDRNCLVPKQRYRRDIHNPRLPRPHHLRPFSIDHTPRQIYTDFDSEHNRDMYRIFDVPAGYLECNPGS